VLFRSEALASRGPLGFAALSRRGDLVRGLADGSKVERVQLAVTAPDAIVSGDVDGSVLVASGTHLFRWSTGIEEVAALGEPARWLRPTRSGTVIALQSGQLLFVRSGERTPVVLSLRDTPSLLVTDTRIFALSATGHISVTELPSLAEWTLPHLYSPTARFAASPAGQRFYQVVGVDAVLWSLPEAGSDFGAWLDSLTNATEVDRHIRWPW